MFITMLLVTGSEAETTQTSQTDEWTNTGGPCTHWATISHRKEGGTDTGCHVGPLTRTTHRESRAHGTSGTGHSTDGR